MSPQISAQSPVVNSKASNFPNECLYTSIGSKPLEAILLSRLLWAQAPEIG